MCYQCVAHSVDHTFVGGMINVDCGPFAAGAEEVSNAARSHKAACVEWLLAVAPASKACVIDGAAWRPARGGFRGGEDGEDERAELLGRWLIRDVKGAHVALRRVGLEFEDF